jgi:type II secretory pathway pseudopilin PulG
LVELAVVIVIIGVLAAFGVPKFLASVERSKAAEAFNYLSAVRSAEERYIAKEGVYADNISLLDIIQAVPKYFDLPTDGAVIVTTGGTGTGTGAVSAGSSAWSMTLTRTAATSSYGAYTVTFTQDGFDSADTSSTIMEAGTAVICPIGS